MWPLGRKSGSCCRRNGPVRHHFTARVLPSSTAIALMLRIDTRRSPAANCGKAAAMSSRSTSTSFEVQGIVVVRAARVWPGCWRRARRRDRWRSGSRAAACRRGRYRRAQDGRRCRPRRIHPRRPLRPGSSGPICFSWCRAGANISPLGATSTAWWVCSGTLQISREQRSILTMPAPSKFITTLPSGSSAAPWMVSL